MLSFFRKLSIGGKIRDGLLPDNVMGTAEDILKAKNQNELVSKDETELKESIYGTIRYFFFAIVLLIVDIYYYVYDRISVNRLCFFLEIMFKNGMFNYYVSKIIFVLLSLTVSLLQIYYEQ